MKSICSNCHSPLHANNFFEQADTHIELYNEGYWQPALALKKELAEKRLKTGKIEE